MKQNYRYDFDKLKSELEAVSDINAVEGNEEDGYDSFMSDVVLDIQREYSGKDLFKAVKMVYDQGYDFKANNGLNGALALYHMDFAMVDRDSIEVVKWMLNNGADPSFSDEWGLQPDHICLMNNCFQENNLQCTLGDILDAYYDKRDYNSIYTYLDAEGKLLTKVTAIGTNGSENEVGFYEDELIFWFGDKPLVVNNYGEMVINPVKIEGKEQENVSMLQSFVGSTLTQVEYITGGIVKMMFDSGYQILIVHQREDKQKCAVYEIRESENLVMVGKEVDFAKLETSVLYMRSKEHTYLMYIGDMDRRGEKLFRSIEVSPKIRLEHGEIINDRPVLITRGKNTLETYNQETLRLENIEEKYEIHANHMGFKITQDHMV